jgi:hypothetical protein
MDASARQFVLWCLEALGLRVTADSQDVYRIEVAGDAALSAGMPLHPYADLEGRRFVFAPAGGPTVEASADVERVTMQSPLTRWLFEELRGVARPMQAAAAHQPVSVHELTDPLFTQYSIEGGHIHLSGCSLEDRPFLRLSFLQARLPAGEPQVVHCFGTGDGELLDPRMIADLELDQLVPWAGRIPRLDSDVLRQWIDVTRRRFETRAATGEWSLLAATLVWCKHAEGKLSFSIGAKSVDVAFAGWGRLLADRRVLPPPYACPLCGRNSYRLAATEDGRITVAEGIAICEESSRRVLVDELERCAETGRRVLPEYLQTCPVTGRRVLASVLQPCSMCQQRVCPKVLEGKVLEGERCTACRHVLPTTKTDPRMARILDAYPKLDRWRSWKMAETRKVQVLVGMSTLRRLLVVLDKQTLDILHVASRSRLSSRWTTATDMQRAEWVG